MISFDEALQRIHNLAQPLPYEEVSFETSANRVLADNLTSRSDAPSQDVSAMDGYGVRDSDLTNLPVRLPILAQSFAGSPPPSHFTKTGCVRIFTGAPVPAGIDRVIIQENVERDGDIAIIKSPVSESRNIRKKGSDFKAGDTLLDAGTHLSWRAMTTAAAADRESIKVIRTPKAVILATGDELKPPGQAHLHPGAIPESVSFGISAYIKANGGDVIRSESLNDSPQLLEKAAASAIHDADIVIVTGGASVGEKDYAKAMFENHGMELIFSKVAIKPGKPVWCAKVKNTIVLGLPGNPTSALVTARLFLKPLLLGLAGRDNKAGSAPRQMETSMPIPQNGNRENFMRGYIKDEKVCLFTNQDSSAQSVLARADILIRRLPNAPEVQVGEKVIIYDF